MINIDYRTYPQYYTDYKEALKYLRKIHESSWTYPDRTVNFHTYISNIKDEREILSVKSFLATQNLHHTKLILWSETILSDHPLLAPFKNLIDFRVYSPTEEAKGTILEELDHILLASDTLCYLKTDLLRLLVPHKHGGIWFDMDMVLLRDFLPLLDQEFGYMWGSETDFAGFGPGAAVFHLKKNSTLSDICLEEVINTRIKPNSCCFGNELLARVYKRMPFSVFPSAFFDTEWQINTKYPGRGTEIEKGWFRKNSYSSKLFLEAFSWHWHNSSHKDDIIEPGSKFYLLNQHMDRKLKERGIL